MNTFKREDREGGEVGKQREERKERKEGKKRERKMSFVSGNNISSAILTIPLTGSG
jgi:hypothetical protein